MVSRKGGEEEIKGNIDRVVSSRWGAWQPAAIVSVRRGEIQTANER
jgi:hypothetical protein